MRQEKVIFLLLVVTVALIIGLTTGVGYASGTVNSFKIHDEAHFSPEHSDFKVAFTGKPTYTGTGTAELKITGKTTATMNIKGLSSVGDYVTATFNIKNTSYDIAAQLSKSVTNSNNKYFKVTATLSNDTIAPRRGEETLNIRVELIKEPINKVEKTKICVKVVANPSYDR